MSKEKWSKITWGIIILCFIILIFVGQRKIKEQNSVLNTINPRSDIQKNMEEQRKIDENKKIEGFVSFVGENSIFVIDSSNNTHELTVDRVINSRTRDKIEIAKIKAGDYYKNAEITRNISGEELKKELLLNSARAFNSSKLSVGFTRLKRLQTFEGYSTFKVRFYDKNYGLFGKENPELFSIELTANEDTVLYTRPYITIYNLQKYVRDEALQEKAFYIEIDEKTLDAELPVVTKLEIAE